MDSHIVDLPHSGSTIGPSNPDLYADPTDRLGGSEPGHTPPENIRPRRRPLLLATAAVVIVGAIGGGFLMSPYNTIYPINATKLQTQGRQVAAAIGRQATELVSPRPTVMAPAAKIAATQAPRSPAPTRVVPVIAASRTEQEDEIRSFRSVGGEPAGPPVAEIGHEEPSPVAVVHPVTTASRAAPPRPVDTVQVREPGLVAPLPIPAAAVASPAPTTATAAQAASEVAPAADPDLARAQVSSARPSVEGTVPPASSASLPVTPASSVEAAAETMAASVSTPRPAQAAATPTGRADRIADPVMPASVLILPTSPGEVGAAGALAVPVSAPRAAQAVSLPPRRAEKPVDPVASVAGLQAAPMTPPEQISVLNEVARLAIVVRDIRAENAALKARVESTADRFDLAVADFTRRLALAEAHGALNAAMGADPVPSPVRGPPQLEAVTFASSNHFAAPAGSRVAPASAVLPNATPAAAVRYRVTAASPGLAILALVDRSGGEGAQIQVATGDQVPGYGRVTAIQQRGATWIVQTDKGPDKGVIQ